MKLTEIKRTDFNQKVYDKASLYISSRSDSKFYFNRTAVRLLDLNPGDRLMFYQDDGNPEDWFIAKTDSEDGFRLLSTSNSGGGIHFHSAGLARKLLKSIYRSGRNTSIIISPYPTDEIYYPLITKSAQP